jgi:hypothetical protein
MWCDLYVVASSLRASRQISRSAVALVARAKPRPASRTVCHPGDLRIGS